MPESNVGSDQISPETANSNQPSQLSPLESMPSFEEHMKQRKLGAKVLTQAGFDSRQKEIVNSSFNKARQHGEKLPGKNNERRNYSYISRLEDLIDSHGNKLEKRLWDASVQKLIIDPENITADYWGTQEQILRDNGQGHELGDYEKHILVQDIQKSQQESLQSWSDYLGDENSPYPVWFKVYAWDGISKMGVFDKEKQQFAKRDKHTVAPYPKLNPAALAKVYGAISNFYGYSDSERYDETPERDTELDALVRSGNFNKLYSKILLSEKAIPKTPERTEDVHGEWFEYLPGEEDKLANAAEGTPWCVADPGTGRNYLEYGDYSGYDYYDDYDDDENHAKFILFHLQDPETGTLSETACASIRLNLAGDVAEISGLNDGQALEDSLVPIVEEKVRTLPGGEKFLEAFADKQQLIALDRKMQNGEDLTVEELEFLYEFNRPIKTLDTYNLFDPRIRELKQQYDLSYALNHGADAGQIIAKDPYWAIQHIDRFTSRGVNINHFADQLSDYDVGSYFKALTVAGADAQRLIGRLSPEDVAKNLDTIANSHIDVNMDELVSQLSPSEILRNFNTLNVHGASINLEELAKTASSDTLADNLDFFAEHNMTLDFYKIAYDLTHDSAVLYGSSDNILGVRPNLLNELIDHMNIDEIATLFNSDLNVRYMSRALRYLSSNQTLDRLAPRLDPRAFDRRTRRLLHDFGIDFE